MKNPKSKITSLLGKNPPIHELYRYIMEYKISPRSGFFLIFVHILLLIFIFDDPTQFVNFIHSNKVFSNFYMNFNIFYTPVLVIFFAINVSIKMIYKDNTPPGMEYFNSIIGVIAVNMLFIM